MKRGILPAIVFAMLGALLWPPQARAQLVHYVDNVETCNGLLPCYTAIMDAVNAAMPSDSIEVFPGVYHEAAVFDRTKNNIILRARIVALRPVITGGVLIDHTPGIQVLDFFLEGGLQGYGALDSVVAGNFINGGIHLQTTGNCTVSRNIIIGGQIRFDTVSNCIVERNIVTGGGIDLMPLRGGAGFNVIRHNVVRGGGISWGSGGGDTNSFNTVEANFVSGGSGIGIHSANGYEDYNIFRRNTSVENTPCDIFDTVNNGPHNVNTWKNNRFFIKCGDATD